VPDDRKEFAADLGHRSAAERRDGLYRRGDRSGADLFGAGEKAIRIAL
jgi:hypothetical protein